MRCLVLGGMEGFPECVDGRSSRFGNIPTAIQQSGYFERFLIYFDAELPCYQISHTG
jgi:hypothetical protein